MGSAEPGSWGHNASKAREEANPIPTPTPTGDNASTGLESPALMPQDEGEIGRLLEDIAKLKADNRALFEEAGRLEGVIKDLALQLEEERGKNLDQKASWWRLRYLELEKRVKESGDFSQ